MSKTAFLKQKNALHFISMTVLVLEIFKFKNFRILNLKTSSNAYAWNKKCILLNNLGGKHSLVMKFVQFMWYYKKKKLLSKYSIKMLDFKCRSSTYLYLSKKPYNYWFDIFYWFNMHFFYSCNTIFCQISSRRVNKQCNIKHRMIWVIIKKLSKVTIVGKSSWSFSKSRKADEKKTIIA